jgi:beta-N-acetylhexosaminidase
MIRLLGLLVGLCVTTLYALTLEQKIGQMLMVGFYGTSAPKSSQICNDIARYHLGGVILFDVNPSNRWKPKNIESKAQLKQLTSQLQHCSWDHKLLIAIDQEGGKVQRLKSTYGFAGNFPKASRVATMRDQEVLATYQKMAKELQSVGVNYNLAPVVDLGINPKNRVIYGLGRSFGSDPKRVSYYASLFIKAMHKHGVLTSLKHFPGHGSSLGDTHKGYVDVSEVWKRMELEPYRQLKDQADTIMVAHVFNRHLDANYPATLSRATITTLLRQKIGYRGVVITDDLHMGAIAKKYSLKETLALAIGAGNDILLIGNQLSFSSLHTTKELVETIKQLLYEKRISMKQIEQAYARIGRLKAKL